EVVDSGTIEHAPARRESSRYGERRSRAEVHGVAGRSLRIDEGPWRSGDRGHGPRRTAEYYGGGDKNGVATIGPIPRNPPCSYARLRNRRSELVRSAPRAEVLLPNPLKLHSFARGFDALERPRSPATESTSFGGGIAIRCVARLPPASVASILTMTALR